MDGPRSSVPEATMNTSRRTGFESLVRNKLEPHVPQKMRARLLPESVWVSWYVFRASSPLRMDTCYDRGSTVETVGHGRMG